MSEASEQDLVADPLVAQVLEAVDGPALVCDREGAVRGWNDAFADRAGDERSVEGARVDAFVDWATDDPVAAALADGTTASAVGKLRGNGRPDDVTVRPLTRESTVGAVVRFDDPGAEPSLRESGERLRTVLDTLPVAMLVVDADGRIDLVQGFDFEPMAAGETTLLGADLDAVAAADETIAAGCRRALDGEASAATTTVGDRTFEACFEPVRADGAVTGAITAAVDVTDRVAREAQLVEREQRLRAVIEGTPHPIAVVDTDGRYRVVNEALVEIADATREDLRGRTSAELFPAATAERIDRLRNDVLSSEAARVLEDRVQGVSGENERTVQFTVAPYHGPDGDVRGTVTIARDVTERERQHEELETVTAIQRTVQESIRGLTSANTRTEIKETVCDRLAASEFYRAAWIGSRAQSSMAVSPDYAAGEAEGAFDAVSIGVDASDEGPGPGGEAYRTGEVQVVGDVPEAPDFEPCREEAMDEGFQSVAVIPLTHGSTTHGILAVYTDRTESFGDREVAGFEALGEAVGFALSAAQHRRLLKADRLLELEYVVAHSGPFLRASNEHDCRFVIENAVHASDGQVINYLTVEDADPAVGAAAAESLDTLESMRRLDGDGGPDFELKWRRSVFQYLAEAGARGTRGTIEDGVGRMVVETPGDVDVRRVTEAMETRFGEAELTAKRERERAEVPWWRVHGDISATLTDRQRAVLQAAYYSGYYEWPRDVDAETLAGTLDVASTTLLQHLRKGHRRVLEAMFES